MPYANIRLDCCTTDKHGFHGRGCLAGKGQLPVTSISKDELVNHLRRFLDQHVLVESKVDGHRLGGEGYLWRVFLGDDQVWIEMDYGHAWVVTAEDLVVEVVPTTDRPVRKAGSNEFLA